jgi:dTDP-glucose pyrophosphorylase
MAALQVSGVPCRDEASLNVVIPMGGSGEAFRAAGYTQPKPMIKIAGRPLLLHLLDTLRLRLGDVVWLIIPSAVYLQFQSQLDLRAEYPQADIRICQFTVLTRGAVETIYIGLQQMTSTELSRRTLCLDCDTLYFSDVLAMFRAAPVGKGMCAYFIDRGTAALYSYLRLGSDGLVAEVREKNAISELANIGAYGFPSASLLREFITPILDSPAAESHGSRTQYFLSNVINKMIAAGHGFVSNLAEDCAQCGTPEKLEQFMEQVSAGRALTMPKRRFCFALDNVLVTPPDRPGDLTTVRPIEKNVQLVRELKESGHHIIITTSRLMQQCSGNVGAVVAACGNQTLSMLEALQIPYDEIHFGQVPAPSPRRPTARARPPRQRRPAPPAPIARCLCPRSPYLSGTLPPRLPTAIAPL